MAEAIALAKELNDTHGLAVALHHGCVSRSTYERNAAELERLASDLIELATRHNFAFWRAVGVVFRGWARSVSGETTEGISTDREGNSGLCVHPIGTLVPLFLALKAEALHLADRSSEALEAIIEAEALAERLMGAVSAELHRLRGVFLTAIGADETKIEASFFKAIRIAKEQKSISLATRAEATYAEYRRQKASGLGGRGFRLPLC